MLWNWQDLKGLKLQRFVRNLLQAQNCTSAAALALADPTDKKAPSGVAKLQDALRCFLLAEIFVQPDTVGAINEQLKSIGCDFVRLLFSNVESTWRNLQRKLGKRATYEALAVVGRTCCSATYELAIFDLLAQLSLAHVWYTLRQVPKECALVAFAASGVL